MADHQASTGHPDMDYAEHERTYRMFLALVKWGIICGVGVMVLLAVFTL